MKALLKHPTRAQGLYKFAMLLSVVVVYFVYLSWKYDLATGGIVAGLTWSFFVLCTPVADAGFLIDFPVRVISGFRMVFSEMIVWALAILINVLTLTFSPLSYETSFLTSLLYQILTTPWPYWSIIFVCALGTFLSIKFGDEMLDVMHHKDRAYFHEHGFKHQIIIMAILFAVILIGYYHLIETLHVTLP
jgi:hypothetical protein|tara:strand:- start:334 stop:903 length:570 start_codon:yes stop_codon:yes gene_type:complete